MKQIPFVLFAAICFVGKLLPQEGFSMKLPEEGYSEPQLWGKNTPYNFVLLNRNDMPVWIQLKNGNSPVIPLYRLFPSQPDSLQGVMAEIDVNSPTVLTIQRHDAQGAQKNYSFVVGKTIYVTWTKEGVLRPQIGKIYGLIPYGRAGFELSRNVQPGDIKEF